MKGNVDKKERVTDAQLRTLTNWRNGILRWTRRKAGGLGPASQPATAEQVFGLPEDYDYDNDDDIPF